MRLFIYQAANVKSGRDFELGCAAAALRVQLPQHKNGHRIMK